MTPAQQPTGKYPHEIAWEKACKYYRTVCAVCPNKPEEYFDVKTSFTCQYGKENHLGYEDQRAWLQEAFEKDPDFTCPMFVRRYIKLIAVCPKCGHHMELQFAPISPIIKCKSCGLEWALPGVKQ